MRRVVFAIGILAILFGVVGIAAPEPIFSFARSIVTPAALYVIGAIRVVVGVVFLLAARKSRVPVGLRVLGVLILVAGLLTPITGVQRSRALLDWWEAQGTIIMRASMGLAIPLGAFLIYASAPGGTKTEVERKR